MKKKLLLFGLVVALTTVAILTGCDSQIKKQTKTEAIKVGFTGPLTGDVAIVGQENLNGLALAVDVMNSTGGINGRQIELVAKDDQLDDKTALTKYKQMTGLEGMNYVLSVTYGAFFSLASQADQDGVILINSLDSSEELVDLSKNTFAIGVYDEGIGYAIADYLNTKSVQGVGLIINNEDPFILLIEDALRSKYPGAIQKENYSFDTKDFRTTLNKLSINEYMVLIGWEETGNIVRQARELGLENKFIGIDTFASQDFRDNTNGNYEGLLFTFWQGAEDNKLYKQMLVDYENKFGKQPENVLFTATGYDSMMVLGEVLKRCGDDTMCVADELRNNIKDFPGATGKITIDRDGITRSIKESIYTYRDGEIEVVE